MTRSRTAAVTSLVTTAAIALAIVAASVPAGSARLSESAAATAEPPARLADLGTLAALPAPAPPSPPSRPTDADVAAAREFALDRQGTVSFAVTSTRGFVRGHERTRTAPSASIVKAPLLIAALREVGDDPLPADLEALLEPMIRASDNAAAVAVHARIGDAAIVRLADRAQLSRLDTAAGLFETRVAASDLARLFVNLHELLPSRHRGEAEALLAGVVPWQRWGLPAALPGRVVMFKGGWRQDIVHQAGVVLVGERRVGIAVLTTGNPSQAYGRATVEGVARRLLGRVPRDDSG
ncbi:MAG: class A beta-lactamase-related serine hydrolase [Solirubrobacteraceae bacterium MAG38_C4-C5]|nr:class A beta-lactamase-related serine hydrolase [Candidatus Siliceabacter maunaloa]